MTLGEYPEQVPRQYRIPLDKFASSTDVGRFSKIATMVGLTARGPYQAGGSVFDDFTGDGLPDLFTTSLDIDRGASFFVNDGNGNFIDKSDEAGLYHQEADGTFQDVAPALKITGPAHGFACWF